MREKLLAAIALTLLAVTLFSVQPARANPENVIKVAWAHPLSGGAAGACMVHHLYYYMVIKDINDRGGIDVPGLGKCLIEYHEEDDQYDLDNTLDFYEDFVTSGEYDLLFAPWSTTFFTACMEYWEDYQYPVVGLTVGSDELSEDLRTYKYNYSFLTLGVPWEDTESLLGVISHINSKVEPGLRINKIGIAFRGDEHGREHAGAIKNGCISVGIAVPVYYEYPLNDVGQPVVDWSVVVNDFRSAGVDGAIICGYGEAADFVWKCITENYNPKMMVIGPAMETPMLVFGPFGFKYGQVAGLMYYNGFPANSYDKEPYWSWARVKHTAFTTWKYEFPWLPFPASTSFYMGLEALFQAVEKIGAIGAPSGMKLNRPAIRDALEFWTFNLTLGGWSSTPIQFKFRRGQSPQIADHGTTTQWQGEIMMDVIWPPEQASTEWIIYPKFDWSWADVPDHYRDGFVDMMDVRRAAKAFASDPEDPRYDPVVDIVEEIGFIDMMDIRAVAKAFGTTADIGGTVGYDP